MGLCTYNLCRYAILFSIVSIDILLLCLPHYFKSSSDQSIHFGLSGVTTSQDFYSYSSYLLQCPKDNQSAAICSNLKNLEQAGETLKIILSLDAVLVVFYLIMYLLQNFYIKKFIISARESQEIPRRSLLLVKCLYRTSSLVVLHPVLISLGMGCWVWLSRVEQYSSSIVIEEGFVMLIFQCFYSLLAIACYGWERSAIKRRNTKNVNYLNSGKKDCNDSESQMRRRDRHEEKSIDTFIKNAI